MELQPPNKRIKLTRKRRQPHGSPARSQLIRGALAVQQGREGNVRHSGVASVRRTGETEAMRSIDLDISGLSVAERIQLAEDLWDSVAA